MATVIHPADDLPGIWAALLAHHSLDESERRKKQLFVGSCFFFPPNAPQVFVKYSLDNDLIQQQAATQSFMYEHFGCPRFRIPKVHRVHQFPHAGKYGEILPAEQLPWSILVMEYINAPRLQDAIRKHAQTPKGDELCSRILEAVMELATVPQPPNRQGIPGPVKAGCICSKAWGMTEPWAPREFASAEDLGSYINDKIQCNPEIEQADFTDEPLLLCHGDLAAHNILIDDMDDPQSQLTLIDFEFTNFLPASFLFWELNDLIWSDTMYADIYTSTIENMKSSPLNERNLRALCYFCWKTEKDARP